LEEEIPKIVPVARPLPDALYYPVDFNGDTLTSQIGRAIYEEFTTVVELKEQRRISDPVWHDFLKHLRRGTVNAEHLKMLRSLIIGKDEAHTIDFSCQPWRDASLVTPRHAVRMQWNDAALRKMCRDKGRQIFKCIAHDTIKGRTIGMKERCILESHRGKRNRGGHTAKDLPYSISQTALVEKLLTSFFILTNLPLTPKRPLYD